MHFQKTLKVPVGDDEIMTKQEIQDWLDNPHPFSKDADESRFVGEDIGDADWFMVAVEVEWRRAGVAGWWDATFAYSNII